MANQPLFFKTWRTNIAAYWEKLVASDLGSGSTGTGTKYLADDMTWKTVTGGGSGVALDFGHRFSTSPGVFINLGNRFS